MAAKLKTPPENNPVYFDNKDHKKIKELARKEGYSMRGFMKKVLHEYIERNYTKI